MSTQTTSLPTITVPITVTVAGGVAPYSYTFAATDTCATFSTVTGIVSLQTDGTYSVTTNISYTNETCLTGNSITVTFVDANGCSKTSAVTTANPCTIQLTITNNGEFIFIGGTTGGTGSYTYEWGFDTGLFTIASGDTSVDDNYLSLALNSDVTLPATTVITAIVTDSNGCTKSASYTYNFCTSTVTTKKISLVCDEKPVTSCSDTVSQYRDLSLVPQVTPCASQVIDWKTITFNTPSGLCVYHKGDGIIDISSSLTTAQTKTITYAVATEAGVKSETGSITVYIPACTATSALSGVPTTIQLTASDIVTTVKTIPVDTRVSGVPDWSTMTITNTPSWGTAAFNGNRELTYTITDLTTTPTVPDTIKWTLQDALGNQINITDTIMRDVIAVPSTVTETICNNCNGVSGPIDVLANDTGDIDRSTLIMTSVDPDIVVVKDSDNNLTFTSTPGASFSNISKYKVANSQGAFSAEQGIAISVACVGDNPTPSNDLTCVASKTFDILDQFTNYNAFNVAYVETGSGLPYGAAGGTIVGAGGTLDFTTIPTGTYTFQFTAENVVACHPTYDDIGTLTVVHGVTPFVTLASPSASSGVYTFTFTYSGISSAFTVTDDGSPATFQTTISHTGGTGTFAVYSSTGHTIQISAVTDCGTTVNSNQVLP